MEHFVPIPYPTPESGNSVPDRPDYQQGAAAQFDNSQSEHPKKRQKRNKPTLSCEECVGRKTKVCDIIYISSDPSSVASKSGGVSLVLLDRSGLVGIYRRCISIIQFPKMRFIYENLFAVAFMDWRRRLHTLVSLHGCVLCRRRRRVLFCGDSLPIESSTVC
jgi:hypothetical protein